MQRRESYVEMNINAYDDTNATSDIDVADRVSGGDSTISCEGPSFS